MLSCIFAIHQKRQITLACLLAGFFTLAPELIAQTYSLSPPSLVWSTAAVGTPGQTKPVGVQNTGSTAFTIESFAITSSQFFLVDGYGPHVVAPGASAQYNLRYMPTVAGTVNGSMIFYVKEFSTPIVVPLSGTAFNSQAVATLNATSLTFPGVSQGTFSAPQTLTITNTGGSGMSIQGMGIDPPFVLTGYSGAKIKLAPKTSFSVQVSMFGATAGSALGELTVSFDNVPGKTVNLGGTVNPASGLVISSLPSLVVATQGGPYLATLLAAGGIPPYTFNLASGSNLPSGLSLAPNGTVSGTVASTVALGRYPFTVQVTDSSAPANTTSMGMSLQVMGQTGSNCTDIVFNVPSTTTPLVPLTDLGTGTFLGQAGGLYPNGSNVRPVGHDAAGLALAQAVQPLDASGNPDPNGKIGMLSIGMSETRLEFQQFVTEAMQDPSVNPKLVVLNGSIDQIVASRWANPTDGVWNSVFNFFLPQAGVTTSQVQVAWVKDADNFKNSNFPSNTLQSQADLESIAQNLHAFFPNLKLAYFTSRIYGGYANGRLANVNYEPYAYETGWAVKNAIADQINGNANLNYNPDLGPVYAPWMAWGPYDWANGMLARTDGLVWSCQDIQNDGIHPSVPAGSQKDANQLMNFFKTDSTTTPWFLAH